MSSFESWLKKQKNRDDPIGDLATDFIRDGCPKPLTLEYIKSKTRDKEVLAAFLEAEEEYKNEKRQK